MRYLVVVVVVMVVRERFHALSRLVVVLGGRVVMVMVVREVFHALSRLVVVLGGGGGGGERAVPCPQ